MATEQSPIFIGDELTAAGYRLVGLRVLTPAIGDATPALARAREQAPLILITAEYAKAVPERLLDASPRVLVAIVPDARNKTSYPNAAARLRRELGMS